MLLESSSELNRTLGLKKKIASKIFWVCLNFCSFSDFQFIEKFTGVFPKTHPRGPEISTVLLHLTKKFPSKFFRYV